MSGKTKLFFTEQAKLSELNLGQLEALLAEGESTIYVDSNNILRIAEKNNNVVSEKNAVGDEIKSLNVGNIPITFPTADTGYSLMAVKDGSNYKLVWGWVDTIGNYNVISGSTTFTVTYGSPSFQIYDATTPGIYLFNGNIFISVSGDGAFAAKKYSLDNGVTFSSLSSSPNFAFEQIGSMTGETYNLVIQDAANETLYNEIINLLAPDYSFDFVDSGLYTPTAMSHVIYKSDDFNGASPSVLEIVVTEDETYLPGLYNYEIYDGLNNLILESGYTPSKTYKLPILSNDIFSAQVNRINAGYIELGEWSSPTNLSVYLPNDFRWVKDGETIFLVPSFLDGTLYTLQGIGDTIRVSYDVTEIGETGGDKKIYAKRNSSNEVYQTTHALLQNPVSSVPTNTQVEVYQTTGIVDDALFASPFISDTYFVPTIITQASPFWVPSPSAPGNPRIDFYFRVLFLSTTYVSNLDTELTMLIEDIEGTLITTETATLINASVVTGMEYEFYISDFQTTISPYFGEIVRIRFVFDPDTMDPDPNQNILSNLKFVRYV
jgi:hypothetical protein